MVEISKREAVEQVLESNPRIKGHAGVKAVKEKFSIDVTRREFYDIQGRIKKGMDEPEQPRVGIDRELG